MTKKPHIGIEYVAELLAKMNAEGGFLFSVLADQRGAPLVQQAIGLEDQVRTAALALVQKTAAQVRSQSGKAVTDEIVLSGTRGQRLVCRPFTAGKTALILAILISQNTGSYRELTNGVIREIQEQWQE